MDLKQEQKKRVKPRLAVRLLLVFIPVVVLLCFIELATRLYLKLSNYPPASPLEYRSLQPKPYMDAGYYSKEFIWEQFHQPKGWHYQEALGFHLPGNCTGQFYNVVNQQRHTVGQPVDPKHTVHIIGGSTIYCSEVPDNLTVPSLVQSELTHRFGSRYRVENYGVGGATVQQQFARLRTLKIAHDDIVIFYDGANDIVEALFYQNTRNRLVESQKTINRLPIKTRFAAYVHRKLRKRSQFVRIFLNPFHPGRAPAHLKTGEDLQPLTTALKDSYEKNLLAAGSLVREKGGRFVHFLQPTIFSLAKKSDYELKLVENPYLSPAGMAKAFEVGTGALREVQSRLQGAVETYDLSAVLDERQNAEEFYLDFCHVNHVANQRIAHFLVSKVFPESPPLK